MLKTISFITLLLLCSTSFAESKATGGAPKNTDTWFKHNTEGWHFYNEEEEPEEEEIKTETPPPPPPEPQKELTKAPDAPSLAPAGPPAMSVEWFKQYMPAYRAAAIDNPTEENVKAYYTLQKVMADKATRFEESAERFVTGDYVLDESQRRPLNSFGSKVQSKISRENLDALLHKISAKAGLLYFFDDSEYSKAMNPAFTAFKNITPEFATIAIASRPGVTGPFDVIRPNEGRSEKIGIKAFPALVLVSHDGEPTIISQSPIALDSIHSSIIFAAAKLGLITDEDIDSTRHYKVRPEDRPSPVENRKNVLPIDPKKIIQMVNNK